MLNRKSLESMKTVLQKAFGINRFSEDLDFTSGKERGLSEIAYRVGDDAANFGFYNEVKIGKNVSEDLSPYLVTMMNPEEILAEKIRAIMTRNKARDIFDELKPLVGYVPDFERTVEEILNAVKRT
jgi:predicted nucleotidyltransferase component of viral defense system